MTNLLEAQTKVWVYKLMLVRVVSYFSKLVHVQLSHERTETACFEMFRQYLLGEFIRLMHYESVSILIPRDDFV